MPSQAVDVLLLGECVVSDMLHQPYTVCDYPRFQLVTDNNKGVIGKYAFKVFVAAKRIGRLIVFKEGHQGKA